MEKNLAPLNIRQRQYGFALCDGSPQALQTRNILVCTTWFGFDYQRKIAFLCHFDTPWSTARLPLIVSELKMLSDPGTRFSSFIANGTPIVRHVWTDVTRRKLIRKLTSIEGFDIPTDLGYAKDGCRSLIEVSAATGQWTRKDYVWEYAYKDAKAISWAMQKAKGSA